MLVIFNTQKELKQVTKRHINVTATLAAVLTPGLPAVYLYQGNLIRTATVEAILEAAPNHVRFETSTVSTPCPFIMIRTRMPN